MSRMKINPEIHRKVIITFAINFREFLYNSEQIGLQNRSSFVVFIHTSLSLNLPFTLTPSGDFFKIQQQKIINSKSIIIGYSLTDSIKIEFAFAETIVTVFYISLISKLFL